MERCVWERLIIACGRNCTVWHPMFPLVYKFIMCLHLVYKMLLNYALENGTLMAVVSTQIITVLTRFGTGPNRTENQPPVQD